MLQLTGIDITRCLYAKRELWLSLRTCPSLHHGILRVDRSTTQDPWRRDEVIEQGEPMRWLWHKAPEAPGTHPLGRQRRAWKLRICDKMVSKME
jgi:hypothetical protein